MKLSLVVPAFNEERLLGETLRHLNEGMRVLPPGWSWELLVCDHNSTDRTSEIARAAGARVVFEPVNQIARARNAGAAAASGDWLVFIDADCSPGAQLLRDVVATIQEGRAVGGGSTVALPGASPGVRAWVGAWNLLSRTLRWAAGSFVFCDARAFRDIGGFSLELFAAEEIDFSRRLKARHRAREFVILHRHPLVTSDRKARLYTWREHLAFLRKMLVAGRRTLRSREACSVWYDGRR